MIFDKIRFMSRLEARYASIAQLKDNNLGPLGQDNTPAGVVFDANLDLGVDLEKIMIDKRAVARRQRLGGNRRIRITTYNGPTTNPTATQEAPLIKTEIIKPRGERIPDFLAGYWTDAEIALNTSEMMQRISQTRKRVDSPEEWARQINTALNTGLYEVGKKNLVPATPFDEDKVSKRISAAGSLIFISAAGVVAGGAGGVTSGLDDAFLASISIPFFANFGVQMGRRISSEFRKNKSEGFRWSLFLTKQYDRLGILKILSMNPYLVSSTDKENNR